MDESSAKSHINGGHTDTNGSSQACFSSHDTKSINSNQNIDTRNGDYSEAKEKFFTTPQKINRTIIAVLDEDKESVPEEMENDR